MAAASSQTMALRMLFLAGRSSVLSERSNNLKGDPMASSKERRLTSRKLKSIQGEQLDAEEQLDGYDGTYLECRDLHHAWRIQGFFNHGGEVIRRLSCSRCKTTREDHWEPNGERIKGVYKYPEGYSIRGSNVKAFDVRREVLHRVKVYANEQQMQQALFTQKSRRTG